MKPQQILEANKSNKKGYFRIIEKIWTRCLWHYLVPFLNKQASSNLKLWGDLTPRTSPWRRWPSWTSCRRRLALRGSRPARSLGSSQTFRLRRRPRRELPLVEMSEPRKLLLPHHLSWSFLETLNLLKSLWSFSLWSWLWNWHQSKDRSSHLHIMDDIKNESLPAGHLGCSAIHLCLRRKQVQGRQAASELSRRL